MTQSSAQAAASQVSTTPSSQSQHFWAEALLAADQLEHAHRRAPSDTEPPARTPSASPLPSPPPSPPQCSSYPVPPDSSDAAPSPVASAAAKAHSGEGLPDVPVMPASAHKDSAALRRAVRFQEDDGDDSGRLTDMSLPPCPPPAAPRPLPPPTTELSYLPQQRDATGSHAYLSRPEYAGTAFGDIAAYMRNKDRKVQTQNAEIAGAAAAAGLPQLFAGLTFYINGNTAPPMEVLRRMVLQRGGTVVPFVRRKTEIDYVVAPVLTLAKFREWQNMRIVTEGFVTQCCETGRVVDWRRWRLRPEGEAPADLFAPRTGDTRSKQDVSLRAKQDESRTDGKPDIKRATQRVRDNHDEDNPFRTPARPTLVAERLPASSAVPATSQPTPVTATPRSLLPQLHAVRSIPRPSHATVGSPAALVPTPKPAMPPPALPVAPASPPADNEPAGPSKAAPDDTAVLGPKPSRPEAAWSNYYAHKSNKQAAELMKSDAFRARHTSERGNEAGFIDSYYQNSRLHHLSTWKAELRVLVAEARASAVQRVPTVLPVPGEERVYLHVDFDAFFVSSGLASRPHLRGKPVVVCHSSRGGKDSTSEVASASYEARAKGVRNGMSLGRARQLVGADLATIPYEFESYKRHSAQFYTILLGYADELEAVSVDEALLDVTGAERARALAPPEAGLRSDDPALQLADKIRDDIRAATGCEVSIGISHNLLLARLATKKAKPAGVFRLAAEDAPAFLADLDVDQLPSVGHSLRSKISEAFGTTRCGDLVSQTKAALQRVLGPKTGETLFSFLRGQDARRLQPDKERRSVSAEINYGIRFKTADQAERYVRDLAAEVAKRLRSIGARGRHMTLKLMTRHPEAPVEPPKFLGHGWCETSNRGALLRAPTDAAGPLGEEAARLLQAMRVDPAELRGVGIMITKLELGPGKGQSMLSFAALGKRKAQEGSEEEGEEGTEGETEPPLGFGPSPDDDQPAAVGAVPDAPPRSDLASTSLLNTRLVPAPPVAGPSRLREADLSSDPTREPAPPSDYVDPDFLAALPSSIRREVEADYAAHRAAKRQRTASVHQALNLSEAPALGPGPTVKGAGRTNTSTNTNQRNPAAHITRQLRPKLKTHMGTKAIAQLPLYSAWSRAEDVSRVDTDCGVRLATIAEGFAAPPKTPQKKVVASDDAEASSSDSDIQVISPTQRAPRERAVHGVPAAELRALGIDASVFAALPPDLRTEVLLAERARIRRQQARVDEQRRRMRASASASPRCAAAAAGRGVAAAAVLRVETPARPALFGARSTDDVCDVLTRWVTDRASPAAADTQRVVAYLVKCVTPQPRGAKGWGLGGVHHVSCLLTCVRGLLHDLELRQKRDGGDEADVCAWWSAFGEMQAAVDAAMIAQLGAPLRL